MPPGAAASPESSEGICLRGLAPAGYYGLQEYPRCPVGHGRRFRPSRTGVPPSATPMAHGLGSRPPRAPLAMASANTRVRDSGILSFFDTVTSSLIAMTTAQPGQLTYRTGDSLSLRGGDILRHQ